jgi:ferredoxin
MSTFKVHALGFDSFEVAEGKKLVVALEENGVDVSHRCGGLARCTTCRVKFISAEPELGEAEHQCLEEDGVLGEFRLSCQIRVDRDMDVEVLFRASEKGWEPGPAVEA